MRRTTLVGLSIAILACLSGCESDLDCSVACTRNAGMVMVSHSCSMAGCECKCAPSEPKK